MEENELFNERLGLSDIKKNLQALNDKIKESQERVRQYTASFGLLREETERLAHVLPALNWSKNFFGEMLSTEEIDHIKKSWSELEKYELKKQAIIDKRDKAQENENASDAEKNLAYVTMEEEIQALNIATLKKTEIWTNLFGSIDKLSKKSVKSQIADIDSLLKYVKTNKAEGVIPSGFSTEEIARINEIAEGYAAGTDAAKAFVKETESASSGLKKSFDDLLAKNHIHKIIEGFKGLKDAAADSKKELDSVNSIMDGFKGVGSAFTEVGKAMDEAGIKAGKVVVTIGDVITKTASMAGAGASVGGPWGAIIGGVAGLASGLLPLFSGIKEMSAATKSYYETLIKVTDSLINKQLEIIKNSTGVQATTAAEEAASLGAYQAKKQREYLTEHLKSRDGHSVAYKTVEDIRELINERTKGDGNTYENFKKSYLKGSFGGSTYPDWNSYLVHAINTGQLELDSTDYFDLKVLESAGIHITDFITDLNGTLTSLNDEQLKVIRDNAPELWAKFDEETQQRLESIIQAEEIKDRIEEAKRQSFTGTTFESLQTNLKNLVSQADLAAEDIGKSFEGHMSNALSNIVKKKYLTDRLEKWYKDFSESIESDDELTPEETEYLRKQYENIVTEANNAYNTAMKVAGFEMTPNFNDPAETRTATAQGIASMSQESADELNGNFYSLFMTVDEILQLMKRQEEQEGSQTVNALPTLQEMLDVSKSSNTYLLDIRNNTNHLIAIDSNILAMRNEGVKIRS